MAIFSMDLEGKFSKVKRAELRAVKCYRYFKSTVKVGVRMNIQDVRALYHFYGNFIGGMGDYLDLNPVT